MIMIKYLLVSFLFLSIIAANAQDVIFIKGDKRINVGIGMQNFPIGTISFDYAVADNIFEDGSIGVGPYIGLGFNTYYTHFVVGGRGTFHYPLVEDLDTYIGATLGLRYGTSALRPNQLFFPVGILLGANYPVNKNIIVFGELGSGVTYITAGITLFLE